MDLEKSLDKSTVKKSDITPYDFIICPNCGETEVGKYCPNCGQSNKDFNKPVKEIMGDLLDSINLDIRIINTLFPFFFKPGFLSQEYFKGKRKRYVPPMRMYMFFSLVFFFLAQYSGSIHDKKEKISNEATISNQSAISFNGLFNNEGIISIDTSSTDSIDETITLGGLSKEKKEEIKHEVENDTTVSEGIKSIIIGGLNASEKKEMFRNRFLKYISYVLFLLMPLFASLLALILWKSKKLYVHHLIFSINFHSFVFGLSSLIIILSLILPASFATSIWLLLWGIPLYLMFGIRQFYNRRLIGAFFKMFGVVLLYSTIISIVLLILVLYTAKDFA